jgi:transmembrane sensor
MIRAKLPVPLHRLLDDDRAASARELQQMWRTIDDARSARRRGRPVRASSSRLAAAALAVVVLVGISLQAMLSLREPRPLQLAGGGALPATIAPVARFRPAELDDGSRITVARGAKLDVLESSAHKLVLALRRGRARFDVRPNGPRAWQIDCGGVTIQVVGTAFVVERAPAEVRVSVERGAVLVLGERVPDRIQRLGAGAQLAVVVGDASAPAAPTPDTRAPHPQRESRAISLAATAWRDAARRKDWNRAWRALRSDGVVQHTRRADGIEDLLLLADVARLSGHPRDAIAPLRRVTEHGSDPRAALAAFMLGRLQLDELNAPGAAALDLSRALELGLPGSLEHDARARVVEAYGRAGMHPQARAAAADYHRRFPQGQRAQQVDRWSGGRSGGD